MNTLVDLITLGEYEEIKIDKIERNIVSKKFFNSTSDMYCKGINNKKNKITKLFINGLTPTYILTFENGSIEEISENHRIKNIHNEWVYAPDIQVDDKLYNNTLQGLKVLSIIKSENFTVDIEVEDEHSYHSPNGLIHHNSISFIANTSSGIEPVFALTYSRKIEKLNKEYETVYMADPIFDEYLNDNFDEKTKEKILKHVADNKGSCQNCKEIPEDMKKVFVVAGDLTPMEHLEGLGRAAQKVSMSISKTINLPKSTTRDEISEVFLKAHKMGIIGVTCYRDGSREGILLHDTKDTTIVEKHAPKRPKVLPCHIYRMTVTGEKWIAFVGLYNDHPYEVFVGKINLVDISSKISDGNLIRVKSGHYEFEHEGEVLIKDLTTLFSSDEQEALTRQISTNLRHGTPVDFVIQQLEKSHGTIVDFNKVIVRSLKRYMSEKALTCPECGAKKIYFDGCVKCPNPECSASKDCK